MRVEGLSEARCVELHRRCPQHRLRGRRQFGPVDAVCRATHSPWRARRTALPLSAGRRERLDKPPKVRARLAVRPELKARIDVLSSASRCQDSENASFLTPPSGERGPITRGGARNPGDLELVRTLNSSRRLVLSSAFSARLKDTNPSSGTGRASGASAPTRRSHISLLWLPRFDTSFLTASAPSAADPAPRVALAERPVRGTLPAADQRQPGPPMRRCSTCVDATSIGSGIGDGLVPRLVVSASWLFGAHLGARGLPAPFRYAARLSDLHDRCLLVMHIMPQKGPPGPGPVLRAVGADLREPDRQMVEESVSGVTPASALPGVQPRVGQEATVAGVATPGRGRISGGPAQYRPPVVVGHLVTARLEKYRRETEEWLARQNIRYGKLHMLEGVSAVQRRLGRLQTVHKANVYKQTNAWLFIESSLLEAHEIANLCKKPVYCTEAASMVYAGQQVGLIGAPSLKDRARWRVDDQLRQLAAKLHF